MMQMKKLGKISTVFELPILKLSYLLIFMKILEKKKISSISSLERPIRTFAWKGLICCCLDYNLENIGFSLTEVSLKQQ